MKFNKIISVLASTALVATMFVGCGDSNSGTGNATNTDGSTNNNDTVTVTFWHYYGDYVQQQLKVIVDEFNGTVGKQNGVFVETVAKANIALLEEEVSNSAQGVIYADSMPDIFLAYADKVLELQDLNVVCDFNDYFSEADRELIIEAFLGAGVIDGRQSILPIVKSTELVFINETTWNTFASATGYTYSDLETWEGLFSVAEGYHNYTDNLTPDIANDGKALFGFDSLSNYITVGSVQNGVDIFDFENEVAVLDMDVLSKVFNNYVEGIGYGYYDAVGLFRSDDIRSGDIISYAGSSASYAYIPSWIEVDGDKLDIDWTSVDYPYFEGEQPYVLSQGAGICMAKTTNERQEGAALFIKYFLSMNVDFALDSAYVPVITEFIEGDTDKMLSDAGFNDVEKKVYEKIIEQIVNDELYQNQAFLGSYSIRTELEQAFEQAGVLYKDYVEKKKSEGMTIEEIKEDGHVDELFQETMNQLKTKFDNLHIKYK